MTTSPRIDDGRSPAGGIGPAASRPVGCVVGLALLWMLASGCATTPAESNDGGNTARVDLSPDGVEMVGRESVDLDGEGWTDGARSEVRGAVEKLEPGRVQVRADPRTRHGTLVELLRLLDDGGVDEIRIQIGSNRPFRVANTETVAEETTPEAAGEADRPEFERRGMAVTLYAGEVHLLSDGRGHPESRVCNRRSCDPEWVYEQVPERFDQLMEGGGFRTVPGSERPRDVALELVDAVDGHLRGESSADLASLMTELSTMYRWRWLQRVLDRRRRLERRGHLAPPVAVAVALEASLPVGLLEQVRRAFCPSDGLGRDPTAPSHAMDLEDGASCRPSIDGFLVHRIEREEGRR